MTTPERLRRRQRINDIGMAILAALLVLGFVYFKGHDTAQKDCFQNYVASSATTSKIRSQLVEQESLATRRAIRAGLSAQSREDVENAKAEYNRSIGEIDRARDANPVQPFPKGVCD